MDLCPIRLLEPDNKGESMQVILTKDVTFTNFDGVQVTIPAETVILVDTEDEFASVNGYNFDITRDEYEVFQ